MLIAIAAMTSDRIIGKNNTLPRYIPADLKKFKELTMGHTVIMWRKTYESLPEAFRPLPGRHNIVLSTSPCQEGEGIILKENTSLKFINNIQDIINNKKPNQDTFVIWWSQIYTALLPYCDRVYITEVKWDYEGDTYFPEFTDQFTEISRESHDTHDFVTYKRVIASEVQSTNRLLRTSQWQLITQHLQIP